MIHGDFTSFAETTNPDPFTKQNSKLLKVFLQYGPIKGRIGSMVAYQGDADFGAAGSGGVKKFLKSKATGEGVPLMDISGTGEVFLADQAKEVMLFYVENDMISCNGASVLAFSASLEHDIQRVGGGMAGAMAGGLYNTVLRGSGYVAVTTHGQPVAFDVAAAPTFADPNAVVLWTGGVQMQINTNFKGRDLFGKGSGEAIQMQFTGEGWVMIQPSELVQQGAGQAAGSQTQGGGGLLGSLGG